MCSPSWPGTPLLGYVLILAGEGELEPLCTVDTLCALPRVDTLSVTSTVQLSYISPQVRWSIWHLSQGLGLRPVEMCLGPVG